MEALASRRAPTVEEVSANILSELASVLAEHSETLVDRELVQALRDGAGALRLEVIRQQVQTKARRVTYGNSQFWANKMGEGC